jgi:hypothetical protein
MRSYVFVLVTAGLCAGQEPAAAPEAPSYDPPATLGHLETTPQQQRKEIDELIVVMFDVEAGRGSLDAKARLAAIGKPAFLPVLAAMARAGNKIADEDTIEARLIQSSLKLADECLREMDGYLDAQDKAPIRPGAERKYIQYVLRVHYRRWIEGMGSPPLKDANQMPGPFVPQGAPAGARRGKYDPPATLGHLETTAPDVRKEIDRLVAVMLDPKAGRDSLEAKAKLAAIGKPAFLPVLGAMAGIRDAIGDTDSAEERLTESALKLADECLREMDGYLDAHDKAPIRPGTEKKYIQYILRIHYRRWLDGMGLDPLKDVEKMPGPFDPAAEEPDPDAPPRGR